MNAEQLCFRFWMGSLSVARSRSFFGGGGGGYLSKFGLVHVLVVLSLPDGGSYMMIKAVAHMSHNENSWQPP